MEIGMWQALRILLYTTNRIEKTQEQTENKGIQFLHYHFFGKSGEIEVAMPKSLM